MLVACRLAGLSALDSGLWGQASCASARAAGGYWQNGHRRCPRQLRNSGA